MILNQLQHLQIESARDGGYTMQIVRNKS